MKKRLIFFLLVAVAAAACKTGSHAVAADDAVDVVCVNVTDTVKHMQTTDYTIIHRGGTTGNTWTRTITGGPKGNTVTDAEVSGDATIVLGWFFGSITFDSHTLTSAGGSDVFLAKFSADGTCLWATRYGGKGDDACTFIYANTDAGYRISIYLDAFDLPSFPSVCDEHEVLVRYPGTHALPSFDPSTGSEKK